MNRSLATEGKQYSRAVARFSSGARGLSPCREQETLSVFPFLSWKLVVTLNIETLDDYRVDSLWYCAEGPQEIVVHLNTCLHTLYLILMITLRNIQDRY